MKQTIFILMCAVLASCGASSVKKKKPKKQNPEIVAAAVIGNVNSSAYGILTARLTYKDTVDEDDKPIIDTAVEIFVDQYVTDPKTSKPFKTIDGKDSITWGYKPFPKRNLLQVWKLPE